MKKTIARKPSGSRRRSRDPFDLYLAGLAHLSPPLNRAGEVAASQRIEAAERVCLDRILDAGVALPELVEWSRGLLEGTLEVIALAQLGLYEGKDGHARLGKLLARAATLEQRLEKLRSARATGKSRERRTSLERTVRERAETVRSIGLGRERTQELIERVGRRLESFVRLEGCGDSADVVQRTQQELGRRAPLLRRLAIDMAADRVRLERARNALAEANLRLVVMLAKAYRGAGVPFSDLVQEGNLGLMRAVDKFDHRVGTRFSTYATWWIRQSIAREVTRCAETVRVPFGVNERRRRAARVARQLTQSLGRAPDEQELANELDLSLDQLRRSLHATTRSVSIHAPMSEDGERTLSEVLSDDAPTLDEEAIARERAGQARALLACLSPREQHILRKRFGIDAGDDGLTLREIGEELELSRERIRQLEASALAKLRNFIASTERSEAERDIAIPTWGSVAAPNAYAENEDDRPLAVSPWSGLIPLEN